MIQVKEKPILFSGPMIRALLDGRKTVTRRIVKAWQSPKEEPGEDDPALRWFAIAQRHQRWGFGVAGATAEECANNLSTAGVCPYVRAGMRLWVRETWAADAQLDAVAPRELSQGEPIHYPADGATRTTGCAMISPGRHRSSIHMPVWASRIQLEITRVWVERLDQITEEQAIAEGILRSGDGWRGAEGLPWFDSPIAAYRSLWESINGAGAWDANPWVWCVSFRRLKP